jgi:hypothetical protein
MMKFSPKTKRLQLFYCSSKGYSAWSVTPNELHTSKMRMYKKQITEQNF